MIGAVLLVGGVWLGFTAVVVVVVLRADRELLADLGPESTHDPDCAACKVADDPTLTSFDLTLWAMECEGAS